MKKPINTSHGRCSKCKEILPRKAFNKCSKASDGMQSQCKICNARSKREWKYGLKHKEIKTLWESAEKSCEICRHPLELEYCEKGRSAHVDHCHDTGKVRGILCPDCNKGLGLFRDSPGSLRAAASYLEEREDE